MDTLTIIAAAVAASGAWFLATRDPTLKIKPDPEGKAEGEGMEETKVEGKDKNNNMCSKQNKPVGRVKSCRMKRCLVITNFLTSKEVDQILSDLDSKSRSGVNESKSGTTYPDAFGTWVEAPRAAPSINNAVIGDDFLPTKYQTLTVEFNEIETMELRDTSDAYYHPCEILYQDLLESQGYRTKRIKEVMTTTPDQYGSAREELIKDRNFLQSLTEGEYRAMLLKLSE